MRPHPDQLAALAAVVDRGTFEAAARALHVTTSAISQRVKALEAAAGQVLVRRAAPCTVTEAGAALLRLARQLELLYAESAAELHALDATPGEQSVVGLPVVVNADSLATWFAPVLAEAATWPGVALRLSVEDQGFSADQLRRGDVLAAVTSDARPVQGCSVEPLGAMRYRPAAAPALAARWRRGPGVDWSAMPMVVFNERDRLQHELLADRDATAPPVVHRVPTSADFVVAVRAGLGWGMLPTPQLDPEIATGRLVALGGRAHLDVPLYWQRWRLESPALARLTDAVRRAARGVLRRRDSVEP